MKLSIRTYLSGLVVALALPLVFAVGYGIYADTETTIRLTKGSMRTLSTTFASASAQRLDNSRQTLERLAARAQIKAMNPQRCDPLIKELHSLNPDYVNIMYSDMNGNIVCSAVPMSEGHRVNIAQMDWFLDVVQSRGFVVGTPHISQITGKLAVPLGLPVWNEKGEMVGTVHLPLESRALDPHIPIQHLPKNSRYGLFREDRTLLWRNVDPEKSIGTQLNTEASQNITTIRQGEFESVAIDGVTRFFSVQTVPGHNIIAFVGVPAESIYAEAKRRALISALFGVAGIVILILITRLISNRIEAPVRALANTARAIRQGKTEERVVLSGPSELMAVADEFNAMVDHRLHNETSLRSNESRLNAFLENSAVIAWLKDDAGRFVFVSENFLNRFQLSAQEIIGKTDQEIWPDSETNRFGLKGIASMAQGHIVDRLASLESVERTVNPNGTESWWLSNQFKFTDAAGKLHIGALAVDITERERSREAQIEQNQFNEQIFSSAQEGVVVYGPDLHYRIWNPYMAKFTGMSPSSVIGRHPLELFPFLKDTGVYDKLKAALKGEIAEPAEFPFHVEQSGVSGWASDRTAPLFNARGEVIGVITTVSDITDRVNAEIKLRELNETLELRIKRRTEDLDAARIDAERLAKTKSEFLANMSHEIRTPLNGVLGLAQLGQRNASYPDDVRETFEQIINSGNLLLGVINDILDFSKIEAGKLSIDNQPTAPLACIEHALSLVSEPAHAKKIQLTLNARPDLPPACLIDGLRLKQILVNLLSNAVKFTEEGAVTLTAGREGGQLQIIVEDSGVGMDANQLSRLFRPFEQADKSTTRRFGGTGLGLAIVRRIIEIMGGNIHVDSEPGKGSRFEVRLPLVEIDSARLASAHPHTRKAQGPQLRGLRILVAEDNTVNSIVIDGLLAAEGAKITLVENGQQALDTVMAHGPDGFDLILMDIQMPVMNGYEATRRIKGLTPGVPIVALTAHALAEERERCLDAGMVNLATKPIDADQLIDVIRQTLGLEPLEAPAQTDLPLAPASTSATLTSASETPAKIDWVALRSAYASTPGMIERMLDAFIKTNTDRPTAFRQLATDTNFVELAKQAHSLKSAFGFLKAEAAMAMTRTLEQLANASSPEALACAERVASELETVLAEITRQRG